MGAKESLSNSYIEQMKDRYDQAHRPRPMRLRHALVTGTENHNSIGEEIADQLTAIYDTVYTPARSRLDVTNPDSIDRYLQFQALDTLICSHGVNRMAWFEDLSVPDISDIIDVNLIGTALLARAFVRHTIDLPWRKQIVFIGSMAYNHVLNASAPYCASKAGLAMLMRCLAWELAPKGYDVVCFHPSNTEGAPMTEATIQGIMEYRGISRSEAEAYWGAVLPRERWLQAGDIGRHVVHFLTDESGYLSGANIELGGGQR